MIDPDSILDQLENVGRKELIERLHKIYPTIDKETRIKFLTLLNSLHDSQHFEKIENYFISDEDPEVRIEAAKLLAFNYSGDKAIKPLIWVLENEEDNDVKLAALRLLVALWHKKEFRNQIRETLMNLLTNKDIQIKMECVESIGILKINSAVEDLISLLHSDKKLLKVRAIQSLGILKTFKAVPILLEKLGTESFDIWFFSFQALKNIIEDDLGDLLLKRLDNIENKKNNYENKLHIKGIIKALGELGDRKYIERILEFIDDDTYWIKEEARQTLDKIEPEWQALYKKYVR